MIGKTMRIVAGLAVLVAAAVLVISAVSTSSARVAATTSGSSFFATGTVALEGPDSRVDMLFDAEGLYPGIALTGCVEVAYSGSVPANVRLHADRLDGDGLEAFIDFEVGASRGGSCDQPPAATPLFAGRLAELWADHPDYDRGLTMGSDVTVGDRLVLHAVATVVDDNAAQGLTTEFALTIEARP